MIIFQQRGRLMENGDLPRRAALGVSVFAYMTRKLQASYARDPQPSQAKHFNVPAA